MLVSIGAALEIRWYASGQLYKQRSRMNAALLNRCRNVEDLGN